MKFRYACEKYFSSRLIAWWGNGWHGLSHVDIVVSGGLLGARSDRKGGKPPGVQLRPMDYLKGSQIRISELEIEIPFYRECEAEHWLKNQIGRQYDMNNILDLILGRRIVTHGRWICSALGDEVATKFGIYHRPGIPPQQTTPDTHHALLCSHGAIETYAYNGPPI
jgi:hypothetical protein